MKIVWTAIEYTYTNESRRNNGSHPHISTTRHLKVQDSFAGTRGPRNQNRVTAGFRLHGQHCCDMTIKKPGEDEDGSVGGREHR
jgi:hypothetical protein